MAILNFGGTTVDIPPFKLREIKAAAPYIERAIRTNAAAPTADDPDALVTVLGAVTDIIAVLAVGVLHAREIRPYTAARIDEMAAEIEGELSMPELATLNPVFDSIMREAGLIRSDPTRARSKTGAEEASSTELSASSPSSLQPVAPEETGSVSASLGDSTNIE